MEGLYHAWHENGQLSRKVQFVNGKEGVACPGVVSFWNELKDTYKDTHTFIEFIDQYPEVLQRTGNKYLGIGVLVRN